MEKLGDGARKRAILGMKAFYMAVITEMQKKLPLGDELLHALTCLNPKMQKPPRSLQYCWVVAHEMPSVTKEEELRVVDEWIKYQEFEFSDEDYKCRVDHFCSKVFQREDTCGEKFVTLLKMVKCALVPCHWNAYVERSLSINKKVVTKQNTKMKGSTITGLRALRLLFRTLGVLMKYQLQKKWWRLHNKLMPYTKKSWERRRKMKSKSKKKGGWGGKKMKGRGS